MAFWAVRVKKDQGTGACLNWPVVWLHVTVEFRGFGIETRVCVRRQACRRPGLSCLLPVGSRVGWRWKSAFPMMGLLGSPVEPAECEHTAQGPAELCPRGCPPAGQGAPQPPPPRLSSHTYLLPEVSYAYFKVSGFTLSMSS